MTTEAGTGGRQPQAKGLLEPPDAGRGRKDPVLEPLAGACPCRCLNVGFLASRTDREAISVVLSHPSVWELVTTSLGH